MLLCDILAHHVATADSWKHLLEPFKDMPGERWYYFGAISLPDLACFGALVSRNYRKLSSVAKYYSSVMICVLWFRTAGTGTACGSHIAWGRLFPLNQTKCWFLNTQDKMNTIVKT